MTFICSNLIEQKSIDPLQQYYTTSNFEFNTFQNIAILTISMAYCNKLKVPNASTAVEESVTAFSPNLFVNRHFMPVKRDSSFMVDIFMQTPLWSYKTSNKYQQYETDNPPFYAFRKVKLYHSDTTSLSKLINCDLT